MTLHVFNPEHDLALAFGGGNFTPPHAARQLRHDLGFLPALWASDGDFVLVDDIDAALARSRHLPVAEVCYVTAGDLPALLSSATDVCSVSAWGWDAALCHALKGFSVPDENRLAAIREISSRAWAARHLGNQGTQCFSVEEARDACERLGAFVLKAPWSSSGRGVRYKADWRWVSAVIRHQGSVMAEPYYNKVKDFAMEFEALADGRIRYLGLSVFDTVHGQYTGSMLASERDKRKYLNRWLGDGTLDAARDGIIQGIGDRFRTIYTGPFGVDMMVTGDAEGYHLQSCVELNLRRTMGHVALALTERLNPDGLRPMRLMRVGYDGSHYHLRVLPTLRNALATGIV